MGYKEFSDASKVWVYQANRELSYPEEYAIKDDGAQFVSQWAAHGSKLKAALEVFNHRFIVLFADETEAIASGCSIDGSVRFIKHLDSCFDLGLFDRMQVAYEQEGKIKTVHMNQLEQKIQAMEITADTIVFNNTVQTLAEFKNKWKLPLQDSWHARMLA